MMKAIWNGHVLAESKKTVMIENNYYFPADSLNTEFFQESEHHTQCFWKGRASYYHVVVDGKVNENAAWYYPDPKNAAARIKNYVAFWKGIEFIE